MRVPDNLKPFRAALRAIQRVIEDWDERGVVIGGVAVSLLSKPRFTADVDAVLLVDLDDIDALLALTQQHGLKPRVPDPARFAQETRVLLLTHEATGVNVDIAFGVLPFEEEYVGRAQVIRTGDLLLRLPTVEDLIILKAIAPRPKDRDDIRALVAAHPHLDEARIERWVRDFGDLLDNPALWDEIALLLP